MPRPLHPSQKLPNSCTTMKSRGCSSPRQVMRPLLLEPTHHPADSSQPSHSREVLQEAGTHLRIHIWTGNQKERPLLTSPAAPGGKMLSPYWWPTKIPEDPKSTREGECFLQGSWCLEELAQRRVISFLASSSIPRVSDIPNSTHLKPNCH